MFEFFGVMALAGRLLEEKIISDDQAEPEIRMGSLASLEAWAGKICRGEGLGTVLGRGFNGLAAEFGEETDGSPRRWSRGCSLTSVPRGR